MTSKKNNQARSKAIRSHSRNADANVLDTITQTLNNYHLVYIREESRYDENYQTKNKLRVPDFLLKIGKLTPVLEIDTNHTHGEFPYQDESTKRRNSDHIRSGNPFSILSEDLAEHLGLDKGKLAVYLAWHSIAIHEAVQNVRTEDKMRLTK